MYLLVIILDNYTHLQEVLTRFRDAGVMGATVIQSAGMGKTSLYSSDAPLIATMSRMFERNAVNNHTVLSVIKTRETLQQAMDAVVEVVGDMSVPDKGIMFSLQIENVVGFMDPENG
ncbi:MAG TPA: hypothetical protein VGB30_11330 [bacterium]|jgi:nitrogen regulatory protein PII